MDYSKMIGERVLRNDDQKGIITKVDNSGNVYIKFEGNSFEGGYMFDPFLAELVRFVDAEKQSVVDKEIERINAEEKAIVDSMKADSTQAETYYITMAKPEYPYEEKGLVDKIIGLSCSENEAYKAFHYYISQQIRNRRRQNYNIPFYQMGLYDTKTNKKIAQES